MRLFIGNATRQTLTFMYWVTEGKAARSQTVPIGGQIQISGDLTTPDIDYIVKQHQKYGMISINEIGNLRGQAFLGYVYSVDKPISAAKLQQLMEHNQNVLTFRGRKIRQEAAIAESQRLEAALDEQGLTETLKTYETTVIEENPKEGDGHTPVSEGVRVQRPVNDPEPERGRRMRKAA